MVCSNLQIVWVCAWHWHRFKIISKAHVREITPDDVNLGRVDTALSIEEEEVFQDHFAIFVRVELHDLGDASLHLLCTSCPFDIVFDFNLSHNISTAIVRVLD